MTFADKIRSMTDLELADFLTELITGARHSIAEEMGKQGGIKITVMDIPYVTRSAVLANLKKTVEEAKDDR